MSTCTNKSVQKRPVSGSLQSNRGFWAGLVVLVSVVSNCATDGESSNNSVQDIGLDVVVHDIALGDMPITDVALPGPDWIPTVDVLEDISVGDVSDSEISDGTSVDSSENLADVMQSTDAGTFPDSYVSGDVAPDSQSLDVPQWPIDPSVVQVHVPGVSLDDDGESSDLLLKLPEDVHSFAMVLSSADPSTYLTLRKLVTPKGKPIVKPGDGMVCIPCENRVVTTGSPAAFLVPNNPDIQITKGTYTYRVGAFRLEPSPDDPAQLVEVPAANEVIDVVILYRFGNPTTVRLPLTLWFTGSHGLTAENAPTDPRLQTAIADAAMLYKNVGLDLVVEDYRDLDTELTVIETIKGFDSDLSELFALGTGQPPERLQVFFVEQIFGEPDIAGIILGIAGGVPGPPFLTGSAHGGVAIAVPPPPEGFLDALGSVLAHEIGHYIGLFHVVEDPSGPYIPDVIADTVDSDTTNVMWWSVDYDALQSGKGFSVGQGSVLRGHPQNQPTTKIFK